MSKNEIISLASEILNNLYLLVYSESKGQAQKDLEALFRAQGIMLRVLGG